MNQYAAQLGMSGANFVDASGLPNPNHYTTAHDIALLSRALIHDCPEEYKVYAVKDFEWNGIKQHNRHTLLWRDSTVDGIKTGHASEAGFAMTTSAQRGDQRLIAVVIGAPSEEQARRRQPGAAELRLPLLRDARSSTAAAKPLAETGTGEGRGGKLPLGVCRDVLDHVPRGRYGDLGRGRAWRCPRA